VLADWWFSLALSKDIYQSMPGKRTFRRYSLLAQKVIGSPENHPLKGLNGTLAPIDSYLAKPALTGRALKTF
jgi:hypothetical protein